MANQHPVIIQGGMGVGVSGWELARAVSLEGQLGVVSGTALDVVLARRLQAGDPGGHMRRALAAFPFPEMAQRILDRFFVDGGKDASTPYIATPVIGVTPERDEMELVVVANFVEVHLAGEGHDGVIGINYLEKIQPPTLPSLFGALLAGVDYVLMGAGIPRAIPGVLDQLVEGSDVALPLHVEGATPEDDFQLRFSPREFTQDRIPILKRPRFFAIVASASLATMLSRKSNGVIDGFVVEGPTAGGHNAPPRGTMQLNERGEPVYGARDDVDVEAMRAIGLPFWLAGSYGTRQRLSEALAMGAHGIQVGTAFAFCQESGLSDAIKLRVFELCCSGQPDVVTDPKASPTSFPFKVLQLNGTASDDEPLELRRRACDLGFLRHGYRREDGTIGWRCPAENEASYLRKGGCAEEMEGRKCVCNGLLATIGLGQVRAGVPERPLVTCGNAVPQITTFIPDAAHPAYTAADVIRELLADLTPGDSEKQWSTNIATTP